MSHKLFNTLGLMGLAWVGFAANAAGATTAAGPYYATPSWDQTLPAATRFIVLTNMNSDAVLDRETGLVWEQSPSTAPFDWTHASIQCAQLSKGGRIGWRLPTMQDLASLVDPKQANPALPSGHPFGNVQSAYWSATTFSADASTAWDVFFGLGGVALLSKSSSLPAWCVRGGQGPDAQ
jgi:hypothetical protein